MSRAGPTVPDHGHPTGAEAAPTAAITLVMVEDGEMVMITAEVVMCTEEDMEEAGAAEVPLVMEAEEAVEAVEAVEATEAAEAAEATNLPPLQFYVI